jgi:hypothetical protein
MKKLILCFLLIGQSQFAQIKLGTYKIVNDAINKNIISENNLSTLSIRKDKTFTYDYLTSKSCLLSYKSDGNWNIVDNNLILTDSVIARNKNYNNLINIARTTIYKIENDNLFFFEQHLDKTKSDYSPLRYLSGNYKFEN